MPTYQPAALPYTPTQAPTAQFNQGRASNTSDPRKIAANQLEQVQGQGDALQQNDANLANQYAAQAAGTQSYLNPIENTLATGGGGYTPEQASQIQLSGADKSQIELSPQDKQNIITGAGISAGAGTASAVGAADRAAAAAGGNPTAMAAYRARAAQTQGAQAGDAMTQARVAAQTAGSQGAQAAHGLESSGAQAVGNAAIGQQNQALNYYGGLQGQQNSNALSEQGLQQGAYGTETSGTTAASDLGVKASQTPSTTSQILGGIGSAAKIASFLAEGTSGLGGTDAVLGEDGPEAIIEAASNPVRSETKFMADGDPAVPAPDMIAPGTYAGGYTDPYAPPGSASNPQTWQQKASAGLNNYLSGSSQAKPPAAGSGSIYNPNSPGATYANFGDSIAPSLKTIRDNYRAKSGDNGGAGGAGASAPLGSGGGFGQVPNINTGSGSANANTPVDMGDILGSGAINSAADAGGGIADAASAGADLAPEMADGGIAGFMADGVPGSPTWAPPIAKPPLPAGLQGRSADAQADIDSTEQAMKRAGSAERRVRVLNSGDTRGYADWAHDDMQALAESAMQKRRMPYAGMKADGAAGFMADGSIPAVDGIGAPTNPTKIITSPTRVHLNKGDAVVPLSYRPQAKVRPSAAMAAMKPRFQPRMREAYAGLHAGA